MFNEEQRKQFEAIKNFSNSFQKSKEYAELMKGLKNPAIIELIEKNKQYLEILKSPTYTNSLRKMQTELDKIRNDYSFLKTNNIKEELTTPSIIDNSKINNHESEIPFLNELPEKSVVDTFENLTNSMVELNDKQNETIDIFKNIIGLIEIQNLNSQKQVEIMQNQFENSQKQAIENAKENKINKNISMIVLVLTAIGLILTAIGLILEFLKQ